MITVNVLLSGTLKSDGYGQGFPTDEDGTFRLTLEEGSTLPDVIRRVGVPPDRVALTVVNGHEARNGVVLKPEDRIFLAPPEVAAMWRNVALRNLGWEEVAES